MANGRLESFLKRISHVRVPLIASIVPLGSSREAEFLHNEVPGVFVPSGILERMRTAESEGRAEKEGVAIARELTHSLRGLVEGVIVEAPEGRYEAAASVVKCLE